MNLLAAQRIMLGVALIAIALSNGILLYSYTGQILSSVLAGAWAAVPILVLYWWAAAKSHSTTERLMVFGCVSVSTAFGLAFFVGRVWNGLTTEPETFMFPVLAPLLLFAIILGLMLLATLLDVLLSRLGRRSPP